MTKFISHANIIKSFRSREPTRTGLMLLIFQAIVLAVVINQPAALRLFKNTFAASAAVNLLCSIWTPATELGDIPTSGLFLKDHIKVQALDDPKIRGVKLYIADTDIPLLEKLNKDFFDNPSATSLACTKVGKVQAVKDIPTNKYGEEVFEEDRNLFLKVCSVGQPS